MSEFDGTNQNTTNTNESTNNDVQEPVTTSESNDNTTTSTNNNSYDYYFNSSKKSNNSNVVKYLSLMLVTSLLTSVLVGGGLYYKFSSELNKQSDIVKNTSIFGDQSSSNQKADKSASKTNYSNSTIVSKIAKTVGPSIVGIKITTKAGSQNNNLFDFGDFGDFGGMNTQPQTSEGSGIVLSKDGYILTNYHVVEAADTTTTKNNETVMEVYLSKEKQEKAKFIGGDKDTDLAVIKIERNDLTVAKLGDSSKLQVGDLAIAIGNPLGLEFAGSVTTGVVSALNRSISTDNTSQNLIQTDAAINPGNSGGALLNSSGEVIGINSIKIEKTGVEGLGFAIPINEAKPIMDQLIKYGKIKNRPMIGITGQDVSETIAKAYDMHVGVYVTAVSKDSGAEKAGIQKGDIIISLAGKDVKSMQDINNIKKNYKAGDKVEVKIIRSGSNKTLDLTFTEEQ